MLQLNDEIEGFLQVQKDIPVQVKKQEPDGLWKMYFDGASSKEGVGAEVLLISAEVRSFPLCTNWNLKQPIILLSIRL